MWAYAVATEDRIRLCRDGFGIKPLFIRYLPRSVAFASEQRALLEALGPAPIRIEALAEFILFGSVLPPHTFYHGIARVMPGECLSITEPGKVERTRESKSSYFRLQ